MHSFVFGSGFCHFCSFLENFITPHFRLKHATANFSWGPLVPGRNQIADQPGDPKNTFFEKFEFSDYCNCDVVFSDCVCHVTTPLLG